MNANASSAVDRYETAKKTEDGHLRKRPKVTTRLRTCLMKSGSLYVR